MPYDFLIVGAGPFGAAFARSVTERGMSCLVIDKREHIAGNTYTKNIAGINVHMYGAHIFHTDCEDIWTFVNQFGDWRPFRNNPRIRVGDRVFSFPVNLLTLHQLWGVTTPAEARSKLQEVRIPCEKPRNAEEWLLSQVGREIYELFFRGYTKKQWFKEPRDLPASIVQRLPFRLTYDDSYFGTTYQAIPVGGYTTVFANMLDGISIECGQDFFDLDWRKYARNVVFTGPIDKYFGYEQGRLEYRSLRFELKIFKGDFQGHAVFNYPEESIPYLRTVEHRHFEHSPPKHVAGPDHTKSVVTFDYPVHPDEPFNAEDPQYPIRDAVNSARYAQYAALVKKMPNVLFGGRLGEYRYYDIDQAIGSALAKARRFDLHTRKLTLPNIVPQGRLPSCHPLQSQSNASTETIADRLHVYALAHNPERHAGISDASYITKIRLDELRISQEFRGEQLAESRAFLCDELDFHGREYQGFANARWNQKYAARRCGMQRSTRSIRLHEFQYMESHLSPDVVLTPAPTHTPNDVDTWQAHMRGMFGGMERYVAEIQHIPNLSLDARGPSLWANNFICHRDVMGDFLRTWRKAFYHLYDKYGFDMQFAVPRGQEHRRVGYLTEHLTVLYFSNRRDLRIVPTPSIETPRLRRGIRKRRALYS